MSQINEGTNKLNRSYTEFDNGINSAYEGSKELTNGNTQINSGIGELQEGSTNLNNGVTQINEALNNADLSKLGQLTDGISKLNEGVNGTNGLTNGVNNYVAGTEKLSNGVITLNTTINNMIANYTQEIQTEMAKGASADINKITQDKIIIGTLQNLQNNDGYKQLQEGAKQLTTADGTGLTAGGKLKAGMSQISSGVTQLNASTSNIQGLGASIVALKENLAKVQAGTGSLNEGIAKLKSGSGQTKTGSEALTNGLLKLSNSSVEVKSALNKLSEGTESAYNGSTQLVEGVETFNTEINKGIEDTNKELEKLDGIENFTEDPVKFETESYGEVSSYGIAFTPLFLSIGLWVGGLMAYVVLYYDQKHRFWIFGSQNENKLLQNVMYIVVGAIEGVMTALLLKAGLGFEIQDMALYLFAGALTGMAFISIIQCLIRNFDDVGKFIALIILVLQLAASGGTFPVETIDSSFQGLTGFLPMTYSIKLLREILVPTATDFKGQYIAVLIGITIVCLGITTIADIIKKKKRDKHKEAMKGV